MKRIGRRGFTLLLGSTGLAACGGVGTVAPDAAARADAGRDLIDAGRRPIDAGPSDATPPTSDASVVGEGRFAERTRTVSPSADGSGDGSAANPWTLRQAMELSVAGDIVGILPGRYVGSQPQASMDDPAWRDNIPAWAPANNGRPGAPIVFVAQYPAAFHRTDRSELYSGATYASGARHGWPCFGTRARDRSSYIEWIGIYSDEGDPEGHIFQDCGLVTCWNADHITIAECHLVGDPAVASADGARGGGGDNYSAIRLEGVDHTLVRDNIMEGFFGGGATNNTGMTLYGVDNLVVEHNDFVRCAHGIQPKGANYGLEMRALTVRLNRFSECSSALRLHRPVANPGGPRSRIHQNLIENSRYFAEITTSGGAMLVDDLDIFNNTIVHMRDGSDPACFWWAAAPNPGTCTFFNNILFDVGSYLGSYSASASAISAFSAFDYNCIVAGGSFLGGAAALRSVSIAQWRTSYSQDVHSLTEDPLLDAEYRLSPSSPCIAAGQDRLGVFGPVGASVDMGAFVEGRPTPGLRRRS